MAAGGAGAQTSLDTFLGGRIHLLQPKKGVKCGSDAILLASLVPASAAGRLVDLGTGNGGVAFAAAVRAPGLTVIGVEQDGAALALARASLALAANAAFADRVRLVEADIADVSSEDAGEAAIVLMNPPYYAHGTGRRSPDPSRDAARALGPEGLAPWFEAARRLLRRHGMLGVILPPARLGEALALATPAFGGVRLYPILSRVGRPALRVVLAMTLGRRTPLTLMPPLVMHGPGDGFSPEAERLVAGEATLDAVVGRGD
ncbi:methyltransferase [Acuticoccus sp. M5D2P5]|uniref:tRNA1(Val) (adenine(37)-N6)-methyltransferase n=1 Tax=Acuticoccus kalidii TaxID=2910977 RepID=UPI001F1D5CBF|nr:methyltransferase [Acuticoccus kalidii]